MDFMDMNEQSESNINSQKNHIIEHNNLLKLFGDKFEDDIRQSLHRMQKDFDGDQNDQVE